MKAKTRLLALSLAFLMVFGTLALSACDEQTGGDKKSYDVTYNLNYDGADKRVYPVQSGTNAPEWKATREGYRIEYWATDSAGKNKYDFSDKVYKDLSLYAVWKVKSGVTTVTFDFGYAGATNKVIEVEKGSTIAEKYKPQHKRFGMELVGWKDGEKAMLSALISVNVITKAELASVKAIDSVKRGKAADFVYKLANVKNAEIVPVKPESKSNLGLILGITVPVVCLAAGAIVFVIIRKKKLLPKA